MLGDHYQAGVPALADYCRVDPDHRGFARAYGIERTGGRAQLGLSLPSLVADEQAADPAERHGELDEGGQAGNAP